MSDVFSHTWLSGLFGDPDMATLWSARAQLRHMLAFEAAWSRHGHLAGLWTEAEGASAAEAIARISLDMAVLQSGTAQDGLPVPALVGLLKDAAGKAVHTGATSQDVMDTATTLSLRASLDLLSQRCEALRAALEELNAKYGAVEIMGRTRMQAALPLSAGHRLSTWLAPLARHCVQLKAMRDTCEIQIGGPVGDRRGLNQTFVAAVAAELELGAPTLSWHAVRARMGEAASLLSLISGSLGKMGQDVTLMAQMGEIALDGGGSSSAMPHKENPILAELLVTLARFSAVQVSGMHQAMVHEQERSGAAWTLEWMILPQMAMATGRGLTAARDLATAVTRIGTG